MHYRAAHTSLITLLLLGFLVGGGPAYGQEGGESTPYVYPTLPELGGDPAAFVPPRWHLLDSTVGDLNGDTHPDLVVVVERDSAVSEERRTLDGVFAIEGRPRILAICLADPEGGGYRKAIQTHRFVLREREGGAMDDPWNGMEVKDRVLHVRFKGGSGMQWMLDYRFALRKGVWELIGVTSTEINVENGDSVTDDYDLVTRSAMTWLANINPDGCRPCDDCAACVAHADCPDRSEEVSSEQKMTNRKLKRTKPRLLSDFEPNLWEIEPEKRI